MNALVDLISMLQALPALVPSVVQADFRIADTRLAKALDRLAEGVVVTDRRGRPLIVNRAATEIVEESDGLRVGPAGICTADAATTATIRRMITAASETKELRASTCLLHVSRPSGRRPFSLVVGPTWFARCEPAEGRPSAIVLIRDLERGPPVSAAHLQQLYGLTGAEAAVAIEVLRGEGLMAVARKLGIGCTTVRSHVQRIFHKTGVRRQAELVSLIAESCDWFRFVDFAADVVGALIDRGYGKKADDRAALSRRSPTSRAWPLQLVDSI